MELLEEQQAANQSWCFWSTSESIRNDIPCLTAIAETLIAVPLYWWVALRIGVLEPLLISVVIAPLVLLRSDRSIYLGMKWFRAFEKSITGAGTRYGKFAWVYYPDFWATTVIYIAAAAALTWVIVGHIAPLLKHWGIAWIITSIVLSILCFEMILIALSVILKLSVERYEKLIYPWRFNFESKFYYYLDVWANTVIYTAAVVGLTWVIVEHIAPLLEHWGVAPTITIIVLSILCFEMILIALSVVLKVVLPNTPSIAELVNQFAIDLRLRRRGISFLLISVSYVPGFALGILIVANCIRMAATLTHLREGVEAMPRNFRRLAVCTSPAQIPEIVPGIDQTNSSFKFQELWEGFRFGTRETAWISNNFVLAIGVILYFPAWVYRLTLKSTAWFWWPLAFLRGDLRQARNPILFHWKLMGSLWARTSIMLSFLSLLAFAVSNLVINGTVFQRNPLLTPLGYLLLVDWTPRLWQICPVVGSLLSVALVFLVNDASGEYRIARDADDKELLNASERKFGWIERIARLRLLVVLLFWCLVATHAMLYINSQHCWFSLPAKLQHWVQVIYGDRLPPDSCRASRLV
jgi:hypothetical protein